MTRAEQSIDQRDEPVGFADDYSRVFAHRRIAELASQQLRGATQTAERIFYFVRELANHQTAAADLGQQGRFASDALMLSRIADLDHDRTRRTALFIRSHGAIDDELAVAVNGAQRELAPRERS